MPDPEVIKKKVEKQGEYTFNFDTEEIFKKTEL